MHQGGAAVLQHVVSLFHAGGGQYRSVPHSYQRNQSVTGSMYRFLFPCQNNLFYSLHFLHCLAGYLPVLGTVKFFCCITEILKEKGHRCYGMLKYTTFLFCFFFTCEKVKKNAFFKLIRDKFRFRQTCYRHSRF
jgi:hypothetical protein